MASILVFAVGLAILTVLLGSLLFQSLTPINEAILSPLEQKCQLIANEGYKIHTMYPNSNPDELPEDDMKRLLYLDEIWIKECVSTLPADSIISITNNVERDVSHGE